MPIYALTRDEEPGVILDIIEAKSPAAAKQAVFDMSFKLQPASARDVRQFFTGGLANHGEPGQTDIFDHNGPDENSP